MKDSLFNLLMKVVLAFSLFFLLTFVGMPDEPAVWIAIVFIIILTVMELIEDSL